MSRKVLITSRSFGEISDEPINILKDAGFEITFGGKDFNPKEFARIIPEYDALIIGAHKFYPEDMERCTRLKIICKHGAGVDNIDLEKAKTLGITVTNAPGTNSNAVADLAFGMMLASARKIVLTNNKVHNGEWKPAVGTDICNKTLGLLGFGAIAKNVARRAKGFGMKVLAYDPFVSEVPGEFDHVRLCGMKEVLENCDFLSLHLPLNDQTLNLISKEQIAGMKEGAYIINTARGGIVNEKDLYEAVVSGHIAGAALDVTADEPVKEDNPLLTLPDVIITSHIGMYTKEAISAVSIICAKNAAAKFNDGELNFIVV